METELTKAEESHVERMSEPFSEPSMQENFESWAERSIAHSKKEKKEKEKNSGPREVSLKGRSDEEREWIEKVAQRDESKDSAKESTSKSSGEKDATERTERPNANEKRTASESTTHVEPIAADLAERHWQGKLQGQEIQDHIRQVDARAGIIVQHIQQHPQKTQIEQGFRSLFDGRPPAEGQAFFRDLAVALAEVANPGAVFHHITMQPQDREFLRNVKTPKELRAAIQTVAKHYPASTSQASPKPKAPRPPTALPGRDAPGDDGTRGETDFGSFSRRQSQRYGR